MRSILLGAAMLGLMTACIPSATAVLGASAGAQAFCYKWQDDENDPWHWRYNAAAGADAWGDIDDIGGQYWVTAKATNLADPNNPVMAGQDSGTWPVKTFASISIGVSHVIAPEGSLVNAASKASAKATNQVTKQAQDADEDVCRVGEADVLAEEVINELLATLEDLEECLANGSCP